MKYEKSCGAVVFRQKNGIREYLVIKNKKPGAKEHWGFPKGHIEKNETEKQTAKREILEETGLDVKSFFDNFRVVTCYSPSPNVKKDVVYFLCCIDGSVTIQLSEIADYKWLPYREARELLTFDGFILDKADSFLI